MANSSTRIRFIRLGPSVFDNRLHVNTATSELNRTIHHRSGTADSPCLEFIVHDERGSALRCIDMHLSRAHLQNMSDRVCEHNLKFRFDAVSITLPLPPHLSLSLSRFPSSCSSLLSE